MWVTRQDAVRARAPRLVLALMAGIAACLGGCPSAAPPKSAETLAVEEKAGDFADYYADLMWRNGMDTINFDGYESLMYTNHGYYAMRTFNRRLFETYHKLTGGKWPRVTGSNVFAGAWDQDAPPIGVVCAVGSAQ